MQDSQEENILSGKVFKRIYRQVNMRMNLSDEKLFFDFLQLNGPTAHNVDMITLTSSYNLGSTSNEKSFPWAKSPSANEASDATTTDKSQLFKTSTVFNLKQLDKLVNIVSIEYY